MVKKIMHDPLFLAQKSVDATEAEKQHGKYSGWTAQIIQHEIDHCNGIVI